MLVETVQLPAVCETVHPCGKTNTTFVSVPTVLVLRHAVPVIAAPVESLSNLTNASVTEAFAFCGWINGDKIEMSRAAKIIAACFNFLFSLSFLFADLFLYTFPIELF